jgi:hypothetical protein
MPFGCGSSDDLGTTNPETYNIKEPEGMPLGTERIEVALARSKIERKAMRSDDNVPGFYIGKRPVNGTPLTTPESWEDITGYMHHYICYLDFGPGASRPVCRGFTYANESERHFIMRAYRGHLSGRLGDERGDWFSVTNCKTIDGLYFSNEERYRSIVDAQHVGRYKGTSIQRLIRAREKFREIISRPPSLWGLGPGLTDCQEWVTGTIDELLKAQFK